MTGDGHLATTVRLTVKQIVPSDLNDAGAAAMDFCFSGFTEPLDAEGEYVRGGERLAAERFGDLGVPIASDLTTPRRFAGDSSLARGRYFTVCADASGDDGGTLVRELGAYHNPWKSGIVTIVDPTLPEHREQIPAGLRDQPLSDLLLLFPPVGDRPHPFAARFSTQAQPLCVTLPFRLAEIEVDDVVDLRRPEVARWFAATLTRLDWLDFQLGASDVPGSAFPLKPPLESFVELLPALLCQSIGGGPGAPQVAGLWLRKLGINGLVFPSARSDCHVTIEDGEVVEWSGFNFVDYRGAATPQTFGAIDLSPEWPTQVQTWPDDYTEDAKPTVYDTVTIAYQDEGVYEGSWRVGGLEARRAAPYCFLEAAWLLEELRGGDSPDVKNVIALLFDFMQKTWRPELARDFVDALMGVDAKRERILRFTESETLDGNPEIRESVRAVLR